MCGALKGLFMQKYEHGEKLMPFDLEEFLALMKTRPDVHSLFTQGAEVQQDSQGTDFILILLFP